MKAKCEVFSLIMEVQRFDEVFCVCHSLCNAWFFSPRWKTKFTIVSCVSVAKNKTVQTQTIQLNISFLYLRVGGVELHLRQFMCW